MYICIIYMYTCVPHIHVYTYIYANMHAEISMYTYIDIYMYIYTCMYICLYKQLAFLLIYKGFGHRPRRAFDCRERCGSGTRASRDSLSFSRYVTYIYV